MKRIYHIIPVFALAFIVTSCFNKSRPNYQYFPDMYEDWAYDTYGEYSIFPDNQEAQGPAEGTINRGWEPFEYAENMDGRKAAADSLKNPLSFTEANVENGKKIYDIYCAICHGAQGDGNGPLAAREKIMGIPGFDDPNRNLTEGDIYWVVYYGLNNMGSYASQTTTKERWQLIHYVQTLQDQLNGGDPREFEKDSSVNRDHYDKEIAPKINAQSVSLK